MQNKKTKNKGLIKKVILIFIAIIILSYFFGLDFEVMVNSPLVQKNLGYLKGIFLYLWDIIKVPFYYILDFLL